MSTRRVLLCATLATSVLNGGILSAQSAGGPEAAAVRRPFRGIFGAPASPDSPHSLILSASAYTAYDDNVLEALSARRVGAPWLQQTGAYQGANAGLIYTFETGGDRVEFRGHAGAQMRYHRRGTESDSLPSSQGDISLSARLTRSLTFRARQSVAYSPTYNFSLTPDIDEVSGHQIGVADDPDLDLFGLRALRLATSLSLSQQFGKNTSLAAGFNLRSFKVIDDIEPDSRFRDYQTQAGLLTLRHTRQITRSAALDLGYGIRVSDGRSRTGEPTVMHNVIAGVNYGRALSFSRRTSFTFGSGSSIAVRDSVDTAGGDRRIIAQLIGHAALVHELGRTWSTQVAYARGFRTRDGFGDLYFTDGVTASLDGLVTRRLALSAAARWSTSSLEQQGQNGHRGVSVSSQATYGVTSYLGLFARYVYYQYRYDEDIPLDPRFPRQLDRQGVRVGLTTSIPLIR